MYSNLHLCMELCTHLSSRNFHTTLVIPSISGTTTTHIPPFFSQNPLTSFVYIALGPPMRPRSNPTRQQSALELQAHITTNRSQSQPPIICAIVDFQIGWTKEVFQKFNIPVVNFITFGACAAAMELGSWKPRPVSSTWARRPDSFPGYSKKWPLHLPILNENL